MNSHQKSSSISQKKEKFRRQIRAEYLQTYMSKIRTQMHDSQEFKVLLNIIQSIQNINIEVKESEKDELMLKKVKELILFANSGKNVAIVAIGELLLSKIITIQMIEAISLDETQNYPNMNNFTKKSDLMKVIKFPQLNQHNEGWLALIRILLAQDYCTEQMIFYCIKTIVKSRSLLSLEFALEVIYILVLDKKKVKIEQIFELIQSQNSHQNKMIQKNLEQKILQKNYLESLMKYSLKSHNFNQGSQIQFFATKIIQKSFSSKTILQFTIIKNISLSRIISYLKQKFQIQSFREKTTTLRTVNDLLVNLKDFRTYEIDKIIDQGLPLLKQIILKLLAISTEKVSKNICNLGYSQMHQVLDHSYQKHQKQLISFIEQGIYFIEVIVDNYLFTHNNCLHQKTNQLLESFTLEFILQNFYVGFVKEFRNQQNFFGESERQYNRLTNEEKGKIWIVENVQILSRSLRKKLVSAVQNLNLENQELDPLAVNKFYTISSLIFSRIDQSQILVNHHQTNYQKDNEI